MKFILLHKFTIFFFLFNCTSFQKYANHRIQDTTDLLTIGIEKGNIGATFFIWCLGGGLNIDRRTRGIGARDGHFGIYEISNNSNLDINPFIHKDTSSNKSGISNILINSSGHRQFRPRERTKNKDYQILNLLTIIPIPSIPDSNKKVTACNAPLKIEGSFGLYYGIRLGFNFSEFFDLIIGFSTLDLVNDDENQLE